MAQWFDCVAKSVEKEERKVRKGDAKDAKF